MLQPLVVTARAEGGYTLIAGERRYRAAKLAGLTRLPVTIRDADGAAIELAVDENLHRQDLNPVEEAHAFQTILSSGRLSKKQLAERVSKSPAYVNERLRLLELPEPVQRHVASGVIPVRSAKQLIAIAKISEPVATCCVQLVADGHAEATELEERPERLIGCLGDYEWPDPQPLALAVSSYQHYTLDSLPLPDGCDDIRERVAGARRAGRVPLRPGGGGRGSRLRLPARDQARPLLVARLHHRPRLHRRPGAHPARPARKAGQAASARHRQTRRVDAGSGGGEQAEAERRRQERQQRSEAKEAATAANFELGRKLQLRYDAPKITTPVAKLLALLILDRDADKLAGRGLRYVREDWQVVEPVESRGKTVDKARYPEAHEAAEQLYAQIERARTPEQVIGRLLQALLAAHAADEEALPQSRRVFYELPGRYGDGASVQIPAILDRLAKPVLPRHLAAKRQADEQDDTAQAA